MLKHFFHSYRLQIIEIFRVFQIKETLYIYIYNTKRGLTLHQFHGADTFQPHTYSPDSRAGSSPGTTGVQLAISQTILIVLEMDARSSSPAAKELQLVVVVVSLCCLRPVRTNAEIREGKEVARSASVRACTRRVQEKSHSAETCLRTWRSDMPERITHTQA